MVEMCKNDSLYELDSVMLYKMTQNFKRDSIKNELINETDRYISSITKKAYDNLPRFLVENALVYNIDIMFMLAQTQIETTFGTAGAGRETSRRSLFGIALKKYADYENAIIDYCEVLKKWYLTKGRTEQHLMNRYTTTGGARYAGNPNYENELRNTYNRISRITKLKNLQEEYKMID
ncbi:glucosaminidase domain-containing protein [bacterium]|nr:glucosaminidase domain-containing protein [bacterium]